MVADPDPDGSDPFQITVGFLEQVAHQLIQTTLDCHLGAERSDSIGAKRRWECNTHQLCPATLLQSGSWSRAQEGRGYLGVNSVEVGELDRACVLGHLSPRLQSHFSLSIWGQPGRYPDCYRSLWSWLRFTKPDLCWLVLCQLATS